MSTSNRSTIAASIEARTSRRRFSVMALALALGLMMHAAPSVAATDACLTGSDPVVAGDAAQIRALRTTIDATCVCTSFDGTDGKTRGDYKKCVAAALETQLALPDTLRPKCEGTVKKIYARATCGTSPALHAAPCLKDMTKTGKLSCSIKSTTKKDGVTPSGACKTAASSTGASCEGFQFCMDAADTNGDLVVAAPGDDGICLPKDALFSVAAGKYTTADQTTGLLTASLDHAYTALERFSIVQDSGFVLLRWGNGKYLTDHGDSLVYADGADTASATHWVIFIETPATGDVTNLIIFKDGPIGPTINALQVDPMNGNLRIVNTDVSSAFSDPNGKFSMIEQ